MVSFYLALIVLAVATNVVGLSRFAIMPAGLLIGLVIGGVFYNFKPYSEIWGRLKFTLIRVSHFLATLFVAMVTLNFFFLSNATIISGDPSWGDRVALFVFVALGVILSAVLLGKRRFYPLHDLPGS